MTEEVKSLLIVAGVLVYIALMALVPFSYGYPFLWHLTLSSGFLAGWIFALVSTD